MAARRGNRDSASVIIRYSRLSVCMVPLERRAGTRIVWRWQLIGRSGRYPCRSDRPFLDARNEHQMAASDPAAITAYAVTLSCVRRSRDAVSKLDWAGDGAERFKAFASAKDRHVAIVKQSPED
jgi:hypothetical protein